jgi:ferrochelatase
MRMWHPFVEEVLPTATSEGARRFLVLPLAPYSVPLYCESTQSQAAVWAENNGTPLELFASESWASHPAFVAALVDGIAPVLDAESELLLTAHSLPLRAIQAGDRYQAEVEACAGTVAEALGCSYRLCYQSAGADGGPWLGPTLAETLEAVHAEGSRRVVVAPIGFVADHVETLYDLDIEAKAQARGLGLEWERVPALNATPSFVDALATIARENLNRVAQEHS